MTSPLCIGYYCYMQVDRQVRRRVDLPIQKSVLKSVALSALTWRSSSLSSSSSPLSSEPSWITCLTFRFTGFPGFLGLDGQSRDICPGFQHLKHNPLFCNSCLSLTESLLMLRVSSSTSTTRTVFFVFEVFVLRLLRFATIFSVQVCAYERMSVVRAENRGPLR